MLFFHYSGHGGQVEDPTCSEEDCMDEPFTLEVLQHYVRPSRLSECDSLILGCTHYPLLAEQISRVFGKPVADTPTATGRQIHAQSGPKYGQISMAATIVIPLFAPNCRIYGNPICKFFPKSQADVCGGGFMPVFRQLCIRMLAWVIPGMFQPMRSIEPRNICKIIDHLI